MSWPTYRGIDGLERPVPAKPCKFCGMEFPSHYPVGMGNCGQCEGAAKVKRFNAFWMKAGAQLIPDDPTEEEE